MIEVRQGCRSCTLIFEPSRVDGWAEYFVEDLWASINTPIEIQGATFVPVDNGLLMEPGDHLVVVKPHRGLKVPWNRQLFFRKDSGRIVVEFLCSKHSVAAA